MAARSDAVLIALVAEPAVAEIAIIEAGLDPAELAHEMLMQTRRYARRTLEAAGHGGDGPVFEVGRPLLWSASRRATAQGCSALVTTAGPATAAFQRVRSRRRDGPEIVLVP